MMNPFRTRSFSHPLLFSLLLSAGAAALVGCSGAEPQATQSPSSAQSAALGGEKAHGPAAMIQAALANVTLRADQKAEVDGLLQAAATRHQPSKALHTELTTALANQIEKGAIKRAELQPILDKMTSEMEKSRTEDRAALMRLHAILDASQRNAFVDALEAHFKGKMFGPHEKRDGEHAERGEHGPKDGPREFHGHHPMMEMAEELKLTDAQRDQIKAAMSELKGPPPADANAQPGTPPGPPHHGFHDMKEFRERAKAALDSFRTDTFTPDALPFAGKPMGPFAHGPEAMLLPLEKIVPILTPEQRTIAAAKLRERASKMGQKAQ